MGMCRKLKAKSTKAAKAYKAAWERGSSATVGSMAILACAAMHEKYGFGEKRLLRFVETLNAIGTSEKLDEVQQKIYAKYPRLAAYIEAGT